MEVITQVCKMWVSLRGGFAWFRKIYIDRKFSLNGVEHYLQNRIINIGQKSDFLMWKMFQMCNQVISRCFSVREMFHNVLYFLGNEWFKRVGQLKRGNHVFKKFILSMILKIWMRIEKQKRNYYQNFVLFHRQYGLRFHHQFL